MIVGLAQWQLVRAVQQKYRGGQNLTLPDAPCTDLVRCVHELAIHIAQKDNTTMVILL